MTKPDGRVDTWVWLLAGAGLALLLAGAPLGAVGDARGLSLAALSSAAALACWAIAGARAAGRATADALGLVPGHGELGLGVGLLLAAGLLGLSHGIDWVLESSNLRTGSQLGALDRTLREAGAADLGWILAGIVVAPALAEELLFRGLLLGGLQRRLGATGAVLVSAALFGLAHLELVHGAAAALLGLYLGALRVATGSIRLGVVCHALNNAAAVAAAVWLPLFEPASATLTAVVGVLGAAACLAAAHRLHGLLGVLRGGSEA